MTDEVSPGGSRVFRHQSRDSDFVAPEHLSDEWMSAIENHFTRHVGKPGRVWHEIVSDTVHVDVHMVPPENHDFWTLFTTGMSARPMTLPADVQTNPYAEIVLLLPPDWRIAQTDFKEGRWYWPIRWMKVLARLPHDHATWLGYGHSIPNGDPPRPFDASTKLCGAVLLPAVSLPLESREVSVDRDRTVKLLTVYPLYAEEMQLKLDRGTDALIDAFEAKGVRDVVDPSRPSAVDLPPRRRFGLL